MTDSARTCGKTGVLSPERVAAVHLTRLLETGPEEAFNRITRLASIVLDTPMVALTVVDDVRSFLKGAPTPELLVGPDGTYESPVEDAACHLVVDSGDVVCVDDVSLDARLRDLPQINQFSAASWIGVPVRGPSGHVLANLCAMDSVVRRWSDLHRETLRNLALTAGNEITLRLALHEADRLADILQQSLRPEFPPQQAGADIAAQFRPGGTGVGVMGDFYDVFPVPGGFGVVIGDVSGKGAEAARTTALARSAVRTAAHSEPGPAAVLRTLDEVLHVWFGGRIGFVTVVYAVFTRPASSGPWAVTVASAGHPPAFVHRGDGTVEMLAGGGQVLGVLDKAQVATESVELDVGDRLVLYTDGVSEAHRAGDPDQFDEGGIARVLGATDPESGAEDTVHGLLDAAHAHARGGIGDDAGVVVVRPRP
ncbi:PP2C family protein-serine/threonine phosphatase [Pseudonocardia sp. N23]|uniref:PP2C family protein-serine/threonine phosphatase n=1 Tax=Pseudonocardia sp. N23 TaxID=1987376 RepID=UPI000BFD9FAD|nr:PP2C family protein-serine/threonine phosphatase [Pseudonocardia sp. N23]GAY12744.1 serine phosphatase RsbU, regulator of sigma subunit [Pseudonocardia sp. N23]